MCTIRPTSGSQLNCAEVLRSAVNERSLGASHGVRSILCRIQTKLQHPALKNSGVLTRPEMRRLVKSARKDKVLRFQLSGLDPLLKRFTSGRRQFELDGVMSFVLHDSCSRSDLVAMANIADFEGYQVASA